MATRRSTTTAAGPKPELTRRYVVMTIVSFVVLLLAWAGFQWLVRDRLGWSMWVVVAVLGALALAGALTARRSTNPDAVAVAQNVHLIGLIGAVFALADAIHRSELLVIWVVAAVMLLGRFAYWWPRGSR
jgi:hypothetical protein